MRENRVNHKDNNVHGESEVDKDQGGLLCSMYNCIEQQLFTIVLEEQ